MRVTMTPIHQRHKPDHYQQQQLHRRRHDVAADHDSSVRSMFSPILVFGQISWTTNRRAKTENRKCSAHMRRRKNKFNCRIPENRATLHILSLEISLRM